MNQNGMTTTSGCRTIQKVIVATSATLLLCFALTSAHAAAPTRFADQRQASFNKMVANLSPAGAAKGAVVAAPSKAEPNYFFHWIRDAGLTMGVVTDEYARASAGTYKDQLRQRLFDWIDFEAGNQITPNPSGGLGEPKFEASGAAFTGPWGRPQNDGPAVRAWTAIRIARAWISEGHTDWVIARLYNGGTPAQGLIKRDLEYVGHHWTESSFDLWEEVRGDHFYTRMMQHRALVEGAALAQQLNDAGAAAYYRDEAAKLEGAIRTHLDNGLGRIIPTMNQVGGMGGKTENLDSAVVLAAIQTAGADRFMSPASEWILASANAIERRFSDLYTINHKGLPATGIGRYPEDAYFGTGASQNMGNPWFLATAGYAELYCRAASEIQAQGSFQITVINQGFVKTLMGNGFNASVGRTLSAGDADYSAFLNTLRTRADNFLDRVLLHRGGGGAISEQFNRENGFMQGAPNLTWSHASFVTAITACYGG